MSGEQTVLLTGFPQSFLARRILTRLLDSRPDRRLLCLVPENLTEGAEQHRLALPEAHRARVELIEGDTEDMDFGMAGPRFLELAGRVNVIHHCAAATDAALDREVARRLNVGGAGEVLELAEAANALERLVFWSTAQVSGKLQGRVLESELAQPPSFHNAVEETRYKAEVVVREAMDHVPTTILRPGIVVGDSTSGEIDRMDGPYLLILLMLSSPVDLRVPLPGRGDVPLNLVPIDYVVEAGCAIAEDERSVGRTFHLVDDKPATARRVFELIAEAVGRPGPVGMLPTQLATAVLRTPGLERFSHVPRTFLEQLATEVVYDTRNTRELLADSGITCPPVASYLPVMVEHARRRQRARARERRRVDRDETPDPLE